MVLGQMGWTTSPHPRAGALSCPSSAIAGRRKGGGEPQNSAVLIGPMSRQTLAGPNRGDVEAVLSYLDSLGQPATIVGGIGGEG